MDTHEHRQGITLRILASCALAIASTGCASVTCGDKLATAQMEGGAPARWRALLASNPADRGARWALIEDARTRGDEKSERALLTAGIEVAPRADLLAALAAIAHDPAEKLALAERAIALDREFAPAWLALATAQRESRSLDDAQAAIERFLALAPFACDGLAERARIEAAQCRHAAAIGTVEELLRSTLTADAGPNPTWLAALSELYGAHPHHQATAQRFALLAAARSDGPVARVFEDLPACDGDERMPTPADQRIARGFELDRDQPTIARAWSTGLADSASLRAGDLVLAVGERKVAKSPDVLAALERVAPGDEVELRVLRDGLERRLRGRTRSQLEAWVEAGELLARAMEARRGQQWTVACAHYEAAAERIEGRWNRALEIGLAIAATSTGEYESTARRFGAHAQASPRNPWILSVLAHVAAMAKHDDPARSYAQQVLEIHPADADMVVLLGEIALRGGDEDAARRRFARALDLGSTGMSMQRLANALDEREAKRKERDNAIALAILGAVSASAWSGGDSGGYDAQSAAWQANADNSAMQTRMDAITIHP